MRAIRTVRYKVCNITSMARGMGILYFLINPTVNIFTLMESIGHLEKKELYTIHAVATDNDGNEIVSDFQIANVAAGDELVPTVIIQDLNRQYLPGQTVFLSANVSDLSVGSKGLTGIVEEVVFYANGFIVDTLPEYPYFTKMDT